MLKLFMKSRKGFTLVELMVVVVILGILTSIAIPVYNQTQDNAREKACFANQRIIEGAAQQHVANDDDLKACDSGAEIFVLLGDYLKAEPECPANGVYTMTVDGTVTCSEHSHY